MLSFFQNQKNDNRHNKIHEYEIMSFPKKK